MKIFVGAQGSCACPAACKMLKTLLSCSTSKNHFPLFPPSVQLESIIFVGQHHQRLGQENTDGHSICPSLSSDEAHFEKCLLWLLLTISTHSVPSQTDSKGEVFQSDRSYFISAGYWAAGRWTELQERSCTPETFWWLCASRVRVI